ncbi:MAG: glycosyltransferase family 4 protein [Ignavibacteria bacterium]
MKKLKILHISPDGVLFGTERHILSIVKNSNRDEFAHSVSVPREGSFTEELKKIGIEYIVGSRMPGKTNVFEGLMEKNGVRKLYSLIKNGDHDIIHSHLVTYGGMLAKLAGKKKLIHTRHGIFWTEEEIKNLSYPKKKLQKIKSNIFLRTIALSDTEKRIMVEEFNYDPGKIEVIYNGVSIDDIRSKIDPSITKIDLFSSNDFIAGSVGRFERQKGFHLFVSAAQKVVAKVKNIKFILIGNGSLKQSILKQINEAGLDEFFIIMDYKKNIFDYLNNFDVMVSSSLWEGVPYAILEAMSLGKPTIAVTSSLSGVNEIISDREDGYLIHDDFVNGLAEKIILMYEDKNKYKELSVNCVNKIKTKFSETEMIKKTENLYKNVSLSGVQLNAL